MTFCHNYFFFVSQFHVKYAYAVSKTITSIMQFQKNCQQFHVQFQKKRSLLSSVVVKPFVILQKKNTITRFEFDSLQKNFFSSCKMLKLLPFYFFWQIFGNFFFLLQLFLKIVILNQLFMQYFFSFYPNLQHYSAFYQTQMKLITVSLKLFETI